MTPQKPFNIFRIFEKDDKELIHSAFLAFLLNEFPALYKDFFELPSADFETAQLEKRHKGGRTDLLITNKENKTLILIENKFRSFPYEEQLKKYNAVYAHVPNKFLICYAREFFDFTSLGWKTFDYRQLSKILKRYLQKPKDAMKSLCINHYCEILEEAYSTDYNDETHFKTIFKVQSENRFWIQLFYSSLPEELDKYFCKMGIDVDYDINSGGTIVPYMNVRPKHWRFKNRELVIQIHGKHIKFYLHLFKEKTQDKLTAQERAVAVELLEHAKRRKSDLAGLDFKSLRQEFNYKTCFIVRKQANSLDNIGNDLKVTMANEIIEFFKIIDNVFFKTEGLVEKPG